MKMEPHHYRKTLTGFEPVSAAAKEWHQKIKLGQIIELKGRRPRNPAHHRKLFALLNILVDNTDTFVNTDHALMSVKAATGLGEWIKPHPKAKRDLFIPASISFDAMAQDDFEAFYDKAIDAVIKYWLPVDKQELQQAIMEFAA